MSMTNYLNERYDDTFMSVYAALLEMARLAPDKTERHIRQTLKYLYVRQGNDWTGRGDIGNAGLDASVAAHEAVLAELSVSATAQKGV
ncbi:MAG: hypothetical protein WCR32_01100 [Geobacter sp.]|jgi:hypothetical protein